MTLPAPETKIVDTWRIACDGGSAGLGHPRVWLMIPHDTGWVDCSYCDARYIHREYAEKGAEGLEEITRGQDRSGQENETR
ncbi:MAG: putative Zn-finger protein [Limimaricola cinnabarinus]|jgi:uncharacterized Zn-finger protein|uniref:Zinc finger CHCC-type domain-containing protein n=1 Tax=Limimaricola cinnabarinus LL-001 TaxID=1337093 RepID=U2YJK5_9RHOB|nr:hypothetical protein MBELCI_1103 [Limimaricola cinnabarinus LL-001]